MKVIIRMIIMGSLLICHLPAATDDNRVILPAADGSTETPSEACFDGTIVGIDKDILSVAGTGRSGEIRTIEVVIGDETALFSVYGGYISPEQLQEGIKLKVWFKGADCDHPVIPLTGACIMIASEKPGEDWPGQ
ncbi:hypothetical protein JW948_02035 [bacterium]|nr:hypothetical protein [bacterium]